MTIESGGLGFGRLGSMVLGWGTFGVLCSGNIVSQDLIDAVSELEPVGQQVSATILIDSVDQSALVESIQVKNTRLGGAKTATIVFIGSTVPGLVLRNSIVEIFFNYVLGGSVYTALIFSGTARTQKSTPAVIQKTCEVQLFDQSKMLDETPPQTVSYIGSALTLIRSELALLGFDQVESTMVDYTANCYPSTEFATVREMINTIVSGVSPGYSYLDSDGVFRIFDAMKPPLAAWNIPLSGQWNNQKIEDGRVTFNQVVATNRTGLSNTYNDTAHQTLNGIISTTIYAPYATTAGLLLAAATVTAKESQTDSYLIEVPVIPFIGVGSLVMAENLTTRITGRIQETNITFSWPAGPLETMIIKEIPVLPSVVSVPPVETPTTLTTIYDWLAKMPYDRFCTVMKNPYGNLVQKTFTITAPATIRYIGILHGDAATPGTVTLLNTGTLATYGPYTLTAETEWATRIHSYSSPTGFVIPAGTYQITESDPGTAIVGEVYFFRPSRFPVSDAYATSYCDVVGNPDAHYFGYAAVSRST